ncbi:hypothetical protein E2562_006061, partial [Oryza meyeriana var. granulata]
VIVLGAKSGTWNLGIPFLLTIWVATRIYVIRLAILQGGFGCAGAARVWGHILPDSGMLSGV